jgi:hypothetical protein
VQSAEVAAPIAPEKRYRNFFKKARRPDKLTVTIDSTARNGDSNVQRRRFQTGSVYKNQTGTLWIGKYAEYVLDAHGVEKRIRHQIVLSPVKIGEKTIGKREAQRLLQLVCPMFCASWIVSVTQRAG